MGTQQLSEAKADQLHALLHYLAWKTESLKEDVDD